MDIKGGNLFVEIYERMNLGENKNDISAAIEWLREHDNHFDCWIDGKYNKCDQYTEHSEVVLGGTTCLVEEGRFLKNTIPLLFNAQYQWMKTNHTDRLVVLHKIVKKLQSERRLFSNLYTLLGQQDDFDLFLDYFNFYSNRINFESEQWKSKGVVVVVFSLDSPTWFSAATSAAALWAGCSVILKPSVKNPFFPFLLAEICSAAGLPNGLVNVVPGPFSISVGYSTTVHVVYDSCIEQSWIIKQPKFFATSLFRFGHTAFIVFDSSDIDAAVDMLFNETWNCRKQSTWGADLVVVQESVYSVFLEKLTRKMRVLDHTDNNFKAREKSTKLNLQKILVEATKMGAKVFVAADNSNSEQILITEYEMDVCEPDAPITTLLAFKTVKEAVGIVNNASFCFGTSIWTENLAQAMEVASLLETCTIWINCHGVMDASVPLEVKRKSGNLVLGGIDGGLSYMHHETQGDSVPLLLSEGILDSKFLEQIARISHNSFMKWKLNKNKKEFLMNISDAIERARIPGFNDNVLSNIVNYWAFNGNSYEITVSSTKDHFYAARSKKPVGVIEMVIYPFEGDVQTFVSWVTPAIAMGNVVIVVLDKVNDTWERIIQCFVKNLPNGIVNIVEGIGNGRKLAEYFSVQAIWAPLTTDEANEFYAQKKAWIPPNPAPLCKQLFAKHCLKNQVIWFPTINSLA